MRLKFELVNGCGVLVDESADIKEDSLFLDLETKDILTCHGFSGGKVLPKVPVCNGIAYPNREFIAPIIFADKELGLSVPILPNWKEFELKEETNLHGYSYSFSKEQAKAFELGYKANKAKYTEEDLKKLFAWALENAPLSESHTRMISDKIYRNYVIDELYLKAKNYIQKVPKYIVVESEKTWEDFINGKYDINRPKLITNSEGEQEGVIKDIIW